MSNICFYTQLSIENSEKQFLCSYFPSRYITNWAIPSSCPKILKVYFDYSGKMYLGRWHWRLIMMILLFLVSQTRDIVWARWVVIIWERFRTYFSSMKSFVVLSVILFCFQEKKNKWLSNCPKLVAFTFLSWQLKEENSWTTECEVKENIFIDS